MKEIIAPVAREELEKELNLETFVRKTNKGDNEVYCFTHHSSPNLMREVGRLREITFRKAGGGTGKELDIDDYDTNEKPYQQLIVWDPKDKEIIGGYRFILCKDAPFDEKGNILLATTRLFDFSDDFKINYIPKMIELGRSFVQPDYQSIEKGRKSLYALDNLWDGLGALTVIYPEIKYFFGKVTMYPDYNRVARNYILYFMNSRFCDKENLVLPKTPLHFKVDEEQMQQTFNGENYNENYKILSKIVRSKGENVPPLVNAYMSLSPTMKCFGTAINTHFGDVEETGIMITISDVYNTKKDRHISTFLAHLKSIKRPKLKILRKRNRKNKE